jgi:Ca2+-binding EF-hand superfamily protein
MLCLFNFRYNFSKGKYSKLFIDRVFQENLTFGGELDYKNYLDFVLATDDVHHKQSLGYMFNILDIERKGYLNSLNFSYFLKALVPKLSKEFNVESFIV